MFWSCSHSHFLTLEFCRQLGNDWFLVLMVLSSFKKCVFWVVSILYKQSVLIDERNWPLLFRGSRSTCHGGFHGKFSLSPGNGLFFALMVLFSFLKHVFWLVSILCKRYVSIDERNWPLLLRGSRSTCHGGSHGEFSLSPWNGLFFALMVLLSFLKHVLRLVSILYKRSVSIDERNWPLLLRGSRSTCHGGFHGEFSLTPWNGLFFAFCANGAVFFPQTCVPTCKYTL
jgi:hypothetical protein